MMSHVEYEEWAEYIHFAIENFGSGGKKILDAGCGTGRFAEVFATFGYTVFGFDRSFEMLQSCRERGVTPVWQADLKNMGVHSFADSVVCLYDTVHYLRPEDLKDFFASAHQALKPSGLLIFDVITESFLKAYWADYMEWEEIGESRYTRKSWYDSSQKCQHTEIKLKSSKSEAPIIEHHRQWLFSLTELSQMALDAGFKELGRFDECTFEAGDEESDRIHFVFGKVG